jgi:hypothetical protein
MLDPVAELGEHRLGHVRRMLRDEEHADALRPDHADGSLDGLHEPLRRVVEEQVRLVEEEDEFRLLEVADLRQLLEELREEPHQHGREEPRLFLDGGKLEAGDDAAAVRRRPQEIRDLELRLAEELVAAAVLELHERAQQDSDRLLRHASDPGQVFLALLGLEERE